ncbi:MarR family winged helix-turn-helix transcriptional regulator [Brevibacillus choshinensis]|uniref:MarR family winged helix-turn-helix transcriptional regulator n=1 Tax=Brevibacillus choshinensis TaxID=54911 RepID=UPI002E1A1FFE|nr:MarR family transcriptional regulator [Brevibacillus choshinensis]MED4779850.1 MarR family transcriptional regulator [Brevibacillus choshinensis]
MDLSDPFIADIRQFNRFYTNILGVLDKHVLDTGYSLTEARVLLEIGFMEQCIANQLVDKLEIDRSYMSRIIAKLRKNGLLEKESSTLDYRTRLLRLTPKGKALFQHLNERSDEQIMRLLGGLSRKEIKEIHASMLFIQQKLDRLERVQDDSI